MVLRWHAHQRPLCACSHVSYFPQKIDVTTQIVSLTSLSLCRIPNLPFFYLVFRAWSHWRALAGGRHIHFLVNKSLLSLAPSPILDSIYPPLLPSSPSPAQTTETSKSDPPPSSGDEKTAGDEKMLLTQASGRLLMKELDIPELEVELERAIWQVERSIRKQKEEQLEKQKEKKQ